MGVLEKPKANEQYEDRRPCKQKTKYRKKLSFATDADIRDLTQTIDKTFDVWFWTPNYLHGLQEKYMILFGKSAPK